MSRRALPALALGICLVVASLFPTLAATHAAAGQSRIVARVLSNSTHTSLAASYGKLPLAFELNEGQAAAPIRFLAHGNGYTVALTPGGALLALTRPAAPSVGPTEPHLPGQPALTTVPPTLLGMSWLGANPHPLVTGEQALPGMVNYFIGHDPGQWHTSIPTYERVRLHNVYPGVDLMYYGTNGQLEYDFVVAPGANPARILLGFSGIQGLGVDLQGDLSLTLHDGTITQAKPLIYQTAVSGARQMVAGGFALDAHQRAGFALGAYNLRLPLVIDPSYKFSTYLGGSGADQGNAIAVDGAGNAYVAGSTDSTDFPTMNPAQGVNAGGSDAFVAKFNPAGTALVYSTYLGGSFADSANGIALDSAGDAYVTGYTDSTNFPVLNAFQQTLGASGMYNAFVTKLTASGAGLWYSTYLGGSIFPFGDSSDFANGIAVDGSGNAYVTGVAQSTNFPLKNAYQSTNHGSEDVFVSKLNSVGNNLVYSTYLGGSGNDLGEAIALDSAGDAYVAGGTGSTNFPITLGAYQTALATHANGNAFLTKLSATGSTLSYSTYLGGDNGNTAAPPRPGAQSKAAYPTREAIGFSSAAHPDWGYGVAVDGAGDAYLTGATTSPNFPVTPGAFQTTYNTGAVYGHAYIAKFNATGTGLVYSTFLEGTSADAAYGIAIDVAGNAYVTGTTQSSDFPTKNPLQGTVGGTAYAIKTFVSELNGGGSALLYSSYLDGSMGGDDGYGIALNQGRDVYVTGLTGSSDFPVHNAFQPTLAGMQNAFVAKMRVWPSTDTTAGVFRPSNGVLYLKNVNTTGPADITLNYGLPGDQPITGDWTGKGYNSIGIYRSGTFYLRNSNTTGTADIIATFGASGDIPVAGDWTGKGYDSIGVYRPSNSTFYLRDSNTSGPPDHTVTLGISGDVPIVGDWTGKGWDSVGVFRPSNGIVYLRNSNTTGFADINFVYGIAGDKPVVGDWDGDGVDTIGVDRNGNFLLRNSNSTGPANLTFYLGVGGDGPIAGPWLAPPGSAAGHGPATPRAPQRTPSGGTPTARVEVWRR